jgi:transcriptional regulator with XRE-family HTH domain
MARGDGQAPWAQQLRAYRKARNWSQVDLARAMQTHADRPISREALERGIKRWESGAVEPDEYNQRLLAKTYGVITAALFPQQRGDADLAVITGMDTLEIITRLRMSDVSPATIEALQITADRLGCEYSRVPADQLHAEGSMWLRRLTNLLDNRLTLTQHREVLATAGQIALLVGCVEYDMGLHQPAEATRRAALSLGEEAGDPSTVGWAHEMRAWYALTQGQYRAAVAATDAGLAAVNPTHSVAVQLLALRAKAWARVGDRRQVEVALDQGRAILEALPYPDNVDNHFVVDPDKWAFYTMDAYRHVGEDQLAETYAGEVIRTSTDYDGTERKPMRTAEARVTLGVVAARNGDLDGAITYGRQALASTRQSRPSLLMVSRELGRELHDRYPDEQQAAAYLDELRSQAAVMDQ